MFFELLNHSNIKWLNNFMFGVNHLIPITFLFNVRCLLIGFIVLKKAPLLLFLDKYFKKNVANVMWHFYKFFLSMSTHLLILVFYITLVSHNIYTVIKNSILYKRWFIMFYTYTFNINVCYQYYPPISYSIDFMYLCLLLFLI